MFYEGIDNDVTVFEVYEARRETKRNLGFIAGPVDFWYDDYIYGRVNERNDVVFPSESFLKEIRTNDSNTILTLNFIADALSDMKTDFERTAQSRLSQESQILTIAPYRAWRSMHEPFSQYMNNVRRVFTTREGSYCDFEQFWLEYKAFLNAASYPFTRTGYVKSKYYDPRSTALFINLFRIDPTDDGAKKKFYSDKNFRFYYDFVRKYGFVVDAYNPSRIVADLKSAPMQKYMQKYNISFDTLFEEYYYKTEETDFEVFKIYVCNLFNEQLTKENRKKSIVPEDLGDRFFAKEYMLVRLQEEGVRPTPSIEKKYLQLFDHSGIMPSVKFLNAKIKRSNASVPSNR